ncbi:hypothetical protein [Halorubrum amylolyticum]|uniref:hypothetical protein n=1 Tax=Halorubrum amylolyticum TaxID=2508724 RepID=UPI0010091C7D|nr:hypothetical protein [Halorubrum amylolyticum]
MTVPYSRRTTLRLVGSSVALVVAGCTTDKNSGMSDETSNETNNQSQESINLSDFTFEANVKEESTEEHPAKIQAALTNNTGEKMTLFTGVTPPLTSYLSGSESDENRLLLDPDYSGDEYPLDWENNSDSIPTTIENGCWTVTTDVSIEQLGKYTELDQNESISQQYAVYGYQSETCPASRAYMFEDTITLQRGQPPDGAMEHEVTIGFTINVGEDGSLSVESHEPSITTEK